MTVRFLAADVTYVRLPHWHRIMGRLGGGGGALNDQSTMGGGVSVGTA